MITWTREEKIDFAERFKALWPSTSADAISVYVEKLQRDFSFDDAITGVKEIFMNQEGRMRPLVKDVVEVCKNLVIARARQDQQANEEPERPIIKWTDYERQARDTFPPWLKKILERNKT